MNADILFKYFEGLYDAREVHNFLTDEVSDYQKRTNQKGSTVQIKVSNVRNYKLSLKNIKKICSDYLAGIFDSSNVSYIANILDLADFVEKDDIVEEILDLLSNPEINYKIDEKLVKSIVFWIESRKNLDFNKFICNEMRKDK